MLTRACLNYGDNKAKGSLIVEKDTSEKKFRQLSPVSIAVKIALIVGTAELAIMAIFALYGSTLSRQTAIWLDTILLITITTPLLIIWVIRPFCHARDHRISKTERLAFYDPLTQLPNRRLFNEHFDRCLAETKRYNNYAAIMYLDLDGFKAVNDSNGHDAGDLVLLTVAERLSGAVRAEDTVCRIGGDEFILLIKHTGTDVAAARKNCYHFAVKIRKVIAQPIYYKSVKLAINCSIGIRILTGREHSSNFALREADLAMYEAKRNTEGSILFADKIMSHSYQLISIGIRELDDRHRELDALIRQAETALTNKTEHIKKIANALISNFYYEESLSLAQNLNLSTRHVTEHRRLEKLLTRQVEQITEDLVGDMLVTFKEILYDHRVNEDKFLLHKTVQQDALATLQ